MTASLQHPYWAACGEAGRPPGGSVVGAGVKRAGGSGSAAETAFQSARRAILRCQGDGYNLPPEKFDQWKRVEMTFNPESMRIR